MCPPPPPPPPPPGDKFLDLSLSKPRIPYTGWQRLQVCTWSSNMYRRSSMLNCHEWCPCYLTLKFNISFLPSNQAQAHGLESQSTNMSGSMESTCSFFSMSTGASAQHAVGAKTGCPSGRPRSAPCHCHRRAHRLRDECAGKPSLWFI